MVQQHRFNAPFQAGNHKKLPTKSASLEHQVQENDIIVMASDGVWDNIYSTHIKSCIDSQLKPNGELDDIQTVANCITTSAEFMGYDPKYVSPFIVDARLQGVKRYANRRGGKTDDITAIVS